MKAVLRWSVLTLLLWGLISCEKNNLPRPVDPVIDFKPFVAGFAAKNQLTDIGIDNRSLVHGYPTTSRHGSRPTATEDRLVYFRYQLAYIEQSDTTLSDAVIPFSQITTSVKCIPGRNAIFPVGLDVGLSTFRPRERDTINFILPPSYGYGDLDFLGEIKPQAILHLSVIIDSVLVSQVYFNRETAAINAYVINSDLNNLVRFPGSTVQSILSGRGRFKRMGALSSGNFADNGNRVSLNYSIRTLDSVVLDNRYQSEPLQFIFGKDPLVEIVNEAMIRLKSDERAILIARSDAAYFESVTTIPHYKRYQPQFNAYAPFLNQLVAKSIIPAYGLFIEPNTPLLIDMRITTITP